MRLPRFKLDARGGTLRWRNVDGRKGLAGDRCGRLVSRAAEQVVAGTGIDFEVSKQGQRGVTAWQPLRMSYQEAVDYLDRGRWTKGLLRRAKACRVRREAKGKPTFASEEYGGSNGRKS